MNEFGEKLKELRGKKSIREASRGIGISHTYLDSLEKGYDPRTGKERKPTIDVLNKISSYYNYDFFELVRLTNLFVSLKDTPDEQKKLQAIELKKSLTKYVNEAEDEVKNKYSELLNKKIPYDVVMFLKNAYNFLVLEINGKDKDHDENNILLISALLQLLVENKNTHDKEYYEDLSTDFDKFLKEYIGVEGD